MDGYALMRRIWVKVLWNSQYLQLHSMTNWALGQMELITYFPFIVSGGTWCLKTCRFKVKRGKGQICDSVLYSMKNETNAEVSCFDGIT